MSVSYVYIMTCNNTEERILNYSRVCSYLKRLNYRDCMQTFDHMYKCQSTRIDFQHIGNRLDRYPKPLCMTH